MIELSKNRLDGALPRVSDYLKKWSEKMPAHTAFIYEDRRISYSEFYKKSVNIAKYLIRIGIKKGDRLAYIMTGRPEFFYFYMAASMIGAVLVGISTRYSVPEMLHIIDDVKPRGILTLNKLKDTDYQNCLEMVFKQYMFDGNVWVVGGSPKLSQAVLFDDILYGDYNISSRILTNYEAKVGAEDGLLIIYTSGSTGKPKGVVLTHRNIISSALVQLGEFGAPERNCTPEDIFQHQVPVDHVSGAIEWGAAPVIGGCTQILAEGFHPQKILKNTEKYKATILAGVPTMWTMMFNLPDFVKYDLSSVRFCMVGGSMASEKIVRKMKEITPYCVNSLGMTECTGMMTFTDVGASAENLSHTVGKCAPEFEMKLVDSKRRKVSVGTPGEIAYRGATIFKEYFNDQERTLQVKEKDGWLYSGDIGVINENGDLCLLGRINDMYICGGFNVYPVEVEDRISKIPGISLVAVLPEAHEIMGEVGVAYIVLKPGAVLDKHQIVEYLVEYLADYKIPRKYVFRESLPLTPLGKIDKKRIAVNEIEMEPVNG